MFHNKDILILSPHIDDAFFSLGYLINHLYKKWHKITIINVFTKTNFLLNKNDESAEFVRIQEEKQLGLKYPNITFINLGFKDAIIRWYNKNTLFSLIAIKDDLEQIVQIKETLSTYINNQIVLIPLWYWHHTDHVLISYNLKYWKNTYYYEDLPYAVRNKKTDFAVWQQQHMEKVGFNFITKDDINAHLKNIKYYQSQLSEKHYNEIFNYLHQYQLWIRKNIF